MRAWLWFGCLIGSVGCGRISFDPIADAADGALAVSPASATINLSSPVTLEATGGAPPYTFAVTVGEGEIDAAGRYFAPDYESTGEVTVTDTAGASVTVPIEHRGARLFFAGGRAMGGNVLASDDGMVWTVVGTLPIALTYGDLIVFDDRLWYVGGDDQADNPHDEVWVSTDGATWTLAGHAGFGAAASGVAIGVFHQEIWTIAGFVRPNADVASAFRSADGITWTAAPTLPITAHAGRAVVHGGKLHHIGGHTVTFGFRNTVYATDGATWTLEPGRLSAPGDDPASARIGDDIYFAGAAGTTLVERTRDFTTWSAAGNLPISRGGPTMVGFRGQMIIAGGIPAVARSTDGGATWSTIGALPTAADGGKMTQYTPH